MSAPPSTRRCAGPATSAYPPGEYVGQESFMSAGEIRSLAVGRASAPGSVLDLCCGGAGPGRLITAELGCDYLGVDAERRRRRARPAACRRPALPVRGRAGPAGPGRPVRRRAPAGDAPRVPGQGRRCCAASRRRCPRAAGSPSPSRRATPDDGGEEAPCPTPTRCGWYPCPSWSPGCSRSGWTSAGWRSAAARTGGR